MLPSKIPEICQGLDSYRPKANDSRKETVFYETWRLYQRVLLAIVATFYINPIVRITFMTPTVILIAISYFVIRPYKPKMYILHWIEVFSILGFFLCLCQNVFRGFLYVYSINDEDSIKLVWLVFAILDLIFSPILWLIYFFIIKPIYSKVKCRIISFYLALRRRYDGFLLTSDCFIVLSEKQSTFIANWSLKSLLKWKSPDQI